MRDFFKQILFIFPTKLPVGGSEFDQFCLDILQTYHLPDQSSYRHAIATMIMHLGPTTHRKSKLFFARSIMKAQANEVAYSKILEFKNAEEKSSEQTGTGSASTEEKMVCAS